MRLFLPSKARGSVVSSKSRVSRLIAAKQGKVEGCVWSTEGGSTDSIRGAARAHPLLSLSPSALHALGYFGYSIRKGPSRQSHGTCEGLELGKPKLCLTQALEGRGQSREKLGLPIRLQAAASLYTQGSPVRETA